jgi:hypothetical protein
MTMNRLTKACLAWVLPLTLVACATDQLPQAMLTYETKPEGAQLFQGKVPLGQAPVTQTYRGELNAKEITTPEVTAVWPSGAKATFWTRLAPRADEVAVISRPANAPGLDKDLAAEAQLADARRKEERDKAERLRLERAVNSAECRAQVKQSPGATPACR